MYDGELEKTKHINIERQSKFEKQYTATILYES